jgi:hypothetical protein
MNILPIEERKMILDQEVNKFVRQGWHMVSRTDTAVQLSRDKRASCLLAMLLLIFFILPALLYLLLYRGTENLYLEVDEYGRVTTIRN